MIKQALYALSLVAMITLLLPSCSQGRELGDELIEQPKSDPTAVKAFFKMGTYPYNVATLSELIASPKEVKINGESSVTLGIELTQAMTMDATVSLEVSVDAANLGAYKAQVPTTQARAMAPAGLVELSSKAITIKAGETKAEVKLSYADTKLAQEISDGVYLVAVRVTNVTGGVASLNRGTAYIELKRSYQYLKPIAEADLSSATQVAPASLRYTPVSFSSPRFLPPNVYDKNARTGWFLRMSSARSYFQFALPSTKAIKGFRYAALERGSGLEEYNPKALSISVVDASGAVTELGRVAIDGVGVKRIDNIDYYEIELYTPVVCSAIRVVPQISNYAALGEFHVFE